MKKTYPQLRAAFAALAVTFAATMPAHAMETASRKTPTTDPEARMPFLLVAPPAVKDEAMASRTVILEGPINMDVAKEINARLIALDKKDPGKPIELRITSPGGGVIAGLQIYDTMKSLKSPVATVCDGY